VHVNLDAPMVLPMVVQGVVHESRHAGGGVGGGGSSSQPIGRQIQLVEGCRGYGR